MAGLFHGARESPCSLGTFVRVGPQPVDEMNKRGRDYLAASSDAASVRRHVAPIDQPCDRHQESAPARPAYPSVA